MTRLNRDAVVALVLLLGCGVFFWATFHIEQTNYGTPPRGSGRACCSAS